MRYRIRSRLSNFLRHTLVQNALSLYGVQIAGYVLPIVTIPYLARVLGASEWGLLAFAQAFGSYWAVLGEYGFSLSATREVACHRDNREKLTEILSSSSVPRRCWQRRHCPAHSWPVSGFRSSAIMLFCSGTAMFWALAQGFHMTWSLLGIRTNARGGCA